MAQDPVCHMQVDESTAPSAELHGQTYHFCSEECRETFVREYTLPADESQQPTAGYPAGR